MNEIEEKRINWYKGSLKKFYELYDWFKENHPDILKEGIDYIN